MTRHALLSLALALAPWTGNPAHAQVEAPPDAPADVRVEGSRIWIRYDGATIFDGRVKNPDSLRDAVPSVAVRGGAVDQVLALHARRGEVEIEGAVTASPEAFPCESDRAVRGLPVVRHSSGLSRSLLNQAVYDRRRDWVLSVDDRPHTAVTVTPVSDTAGSRTFSLEARGSEIVLRFRPRFYQQHRGLTYFEPWTYAVWPSPVVGWCSWFAFLSQVTEGDVRRAADVLSEVLRPWGYDTLQIDDGYQQGTGLPELWLKTNAKFPDGLEAIAAYVRGKGLRPGIWTNVAFSQTEYARQHREWFVEDPAGDVASGNWIGHPVDSTAKGALDALVRPIYEGLRAMGWQYFKLDALRHLRYEGYNAYRGHFERKNVAPPTRSAATSPRCATRSAATGSCSPAGASGPSWWASSTAVASAPTASPTPGSPSSTRSTTWSGATIPTTSS
jgi:hypothetical protein